MAHWIHLSVVYGACSIPRIFKYLDSSIDSYLPDADVDGVELWDKKIDRA